MSDQSALRLVCPPTDGGGGAKGGDGDDAPAWGWQQRWWRSAVSSGVIAALDPSEHVVLSIYLAWANSRTRRAWPFLDRVCDEAGRSRRSVQRGLRSLCRRGLIALEKRGGRGSASVYRLCEDPARATPSLRMAGSSEGSASAKGRNHCRKRAQPLSQKGDSGDAPDAPRTREDAPRRAPARESPGHDDAPSAAEGERAERAGGSFKQAEPERRRPPTASQLEADLEHGLFGAWAIVDLLTDRGLERADADRQVREQGVERCREAAAHVDAVAERGEIRTSWVRFFCSFVRSGRDADTAAPPDPIFEPADAKCDPEQPDVIEYPHRGGSDPDAAFADMRIAAMDAHEIERVRQRVVAELPSAMQRFFRDRRWDHERMLPLLRRRVLDRVDEEMESQR